MNDVLNTGFPPQQLSFKSKTKAWRKRCVDYFDSRGVANYSLVRKSVMHKQINYDLVNGILHMNDMELILNPSGIKAEFITDKLQHYPIINSKLEVLQGEESRRVFDYRVIVTNPTAISEIEEQKKNEANAALQEWVTSQYESEEEAQQALEQMGQYFSYEYQDKREMRGNRILKHYASELDMPSMFNEGFMDGMIVGEELYQCDIVGGEPIIYKLNPKKVRVYKSGFSNKVEDADIIVIEDYWSPGKVVDYYYDVLTARDRKYLESVHTDADSGSVDSMGNIDEREGFINIGSYMQTDLAGTRSPFAEDPMEEFLGGALSGSPFDSYGNIRVLRVYWKSRRKIKKVKSYNIQTGEEEYNFYTEEKVINPDLGEEETIYWINEAWEGTKIGKDIYVNMRPRVVQYNRMSNPSICHFGIIGTIYNINEARPFSMVDMMKPYSYLYDVVHDRLNKLLARTWGSIMRLDLAKKPKSWNVDKWLYFAKNVGLAVEDSFNEGDKGAATGKLAGGLNNASTGVIAANDGNLIQQYINILEFIKMEMSEVAGITKQREGQVSNRETVGGVERATLQSSHITEWLFIKHESTKKRVLECFLETAKAAFKGRTLKFQYIAADRAMRSMEIDGDEFAECDYGLVVDNSNATQELNQKLDMLAQAALQNQAIDFSTVMKLYTSASISEKMRMVEVNEQQLREMQQQQQQQQMQLQQQQLEQQAQAVQAQMDQELLMSREKNDTSIKVAIINGEAEAQRFAMMNHDEEQEPVFTEEAKAKLKESMRQFDAKLKLDREKLDLDRKKQSDDKALKERQLSIQSRKTTSTK